MFNISKVTLFAAVSCIFTVLPATAPVALEADADGCVCQTPAPPGGGDQVGSLVTVEGNVTINRSDGPGEAQSGDTLSIGSEMLTGPDGKAAMVVGTCAEAAPPNSNVFISRVPQTGNTCVRIVEDDTAVVPGVGLAGILGGGALAGGAGTGIYFATRDSDKKSD